MCLHKGKKRTKQIERKSSSSSLWSSWSSTSLAHRCTIFLCIWDRNTNMNDKDHLVGQLTNFHGDTKLRDIQRIDGFPDMKLKCIDLFPKSECGGGLGQCRQTLLCQPSLVWRPSTSTQLITTIVIITTIRKSSGIFT